MKYYDFIKNNFDNFYGVDYKLVDIKEILYPYYKVTVLLALREEFPFSVVEEYFLKSIDYGLKDIKEIQLFLGLDEMIFEEIASDFHFSGLFEYNPTIHLTEKGKERLKSLSTTQIIHEEKFLFLDGITGEAFLRVPKISNEKKDNILSLRPIIKYPRTENLTSSYLPEVDRTLYSTIIEVFKKFYSDSKESSTKKEVVDIKELKQNSPKLNEKHYILFFHDYKSDEDKLLVITDEEKNIELSNKLMEMEDSGLRLINFNKIINTNNHSEEINKFPIEIIRNINDIDKLENGANVGTISTPFFVEKALKESTSQIIINSPWVRKQVVNFDFRRNLEDALKREVNILIIYGMGKRDERDKDDIDKETEHYFEKLKNQYKKLFRTIKTEQNHAKILISDVKFMLKGSYNILSYKNDSNRKMTFESGTFIKEKKIIQEMITELDRNFKIKQYL